MVRSGWTSSSQAKASRPTAAGHTPIRSGSRTRPASGSTPAIRVSPPEMVRIGFVARQIWPNSNDSGTRPTQIQTNTKPKTGLVSRS